MTTKKPKSSRSVRIALTVPAEVNGVLVQLQKLTGDAKTKIITELLVESKPALEQAVSALEMIKEGQKQAAFVAMQEYLSESTKALTQATFDLGEMKGTD